MKKIPISVYIIEAILLIFTVYFFPFRQTFFRYDTAEEDLSSSLHVNASDTCNVFTYHDIKFYQAVKYSNYFSVTFENFSPVNTDKKITTELINTYIRKDGRGWIPPKKSIGSMYEYINYKVYIVDADNKTIIWVIDKTSYRDENYTDKVYDSIGSEIITNRVVLGSYISTIGLLLWINSRMTICLELTISNLR